MYEKTATNQIADINMAIRLLTDLKDRITQGDIIIVNTMRCQLSGVAGEPEQIKIEFGFIHHNNPPHKQSDF
jgi:hypothetical protein